MAAIRCITFGLAVSLGLGVVQAAGLPAARVADTVSSPVGAPGDIVGPGAPTVLIEGMPAARMGDQVLCAQAVLGGVEHILQPIITGSPTVLIEGLPAARLSDSTAGDCVIITGSPKVLIGN